MARLRPMLLPAPLLLALAAPPAALADNPTVGQVFAVGDHVQPGDTLTILGGQLEPGDTLVLHMTAGGRTIDLGTAVVAPDGTLHHEATVPESTPLGYAAITASDLAGSEWTANVLIGDRPEGPGAQDPSTGPIDDRAIGLALAGIGTVLFLIAGAWYLRGRPRRSGGAD